MSFENVAKEAQNIRNSNRLSKEDTQVLRNLKIKLCNPILPQHRVEPRAGSRPPTEEEMDEFEEYASIHKGYFDSSEDKIIKQNWNLFCEMHNWHPEQTKPFLLLRVGNKTNIRSKRERRKFVQFLADGLPHRTLYSVYHRFRNLFADRVHRRFLPEEDKMILDHLERNENLDEKRKYTDLAQVLKRTRASIWRRYTLLKQKRKDTDKQKSKLGCEPRTNPDRTGLRA
ncbi:uncharacterized protein LOC143219400 [Lasioglossum baleicum]|uniref:uncharacterized protein LOC143219400 n=1 Tax=Lasioglossum baleicum TaxID=434251 RepID=UPI003FCDD5A5